MIVIGLTVLFMTAAINDWSQHFQPNKCKNINIEPTKPSKEKHILPLVNQPFSLHYWLIKLRLGFAHQSFASEQEGLFHLPQCTIPHTEGIMGGGSRG